MSNSELNAAGIMDPELRESYKICKDLNRQHGKTYYLATLLLPKAKRPYVHALYGFARYADEIVDNLESTLTQEEKSAWLDNWSSQFFQELTSGHSSDPVTRATIDTIKRWGIPVEHFHAFIHSMKMDLTVTRYETYEDLYEYVYGSAAVIGLQMVPILEPHDQRAYDYAQKLGVAFQLANFIRDVGEDLERGRVYLPMAELRAFGVDEQMLVARKVTPEIKSALAYQIARVKKLERESKPGIELLHPSSRPCIEAARILYCAIVDEVSRNDFDVFAKRAKVSTAKRVSVWAKARLALQRI